MIPLLATLNDLSPLAVIALLALIILMQVRNRRSVTSLRDNHLHTLIGGLAEAVACLRRIEERQNSMNDCLIWIKARLNGQR